MNQDDIIKMAQEAFDKEFPEYAAELAMYDAGSPAVSALDTIVARRALSVWKCAYAAGAAAERKRIINLLMIQHEMAQGRHNYYGHVALLIEADKGVANDT